MVRILLILLIAIPVLGKNLKLTDPPCIKEAIMKCIKDSTSDFGYLRIKGSIDQEVDFSQLKAYVALKIYKFDYAQLDTAFNSYAGNIEDFLIPTGRWNIPVFYQGKVLYELEILLKNGQCEFYQAHFNNPEIEKCALEQIDLQSIKHYGNYPVIIETSYDTYVYYPKEKNKRLLHVKFQYKHPRRYELKLARGPGVNSYVMEKDKKELLTEVRNVYKRAKEKRDRLPLQERPNLPFKPGEE